MAKFLLGSPENPVRLSWPRLGQLTQGPNDRAPKVSTAVLIPKTDADTLGRLQAAIQAAIAEKWGAKVPDGLSTPVKDGDARAESYPEQAGHVLVNTKSRRMVPVVGADLVPVDAADGGVVYGGANAVVCVSAYAYDVPGNRGVALGLEAVQVVGGGEPLGDGGGASAVGMFTAAPAIAGSPVAPVGSLASDPLAGLL